MTLATLKITLLREGNENEDLNTALAILQISGDARDVDKNEGIIRDDDGLLAVWEIGEAYE